MWWSTFLDHWNGYISLLQEYGPLHASYHCTTDASGSFGCGTLWRSQWLQLRWTPTYGAPSRRRRKIRLTLKELLPVILACTVWGQYWSNSMVLVHCDNTGAVAASNSGYSKAPEIMHLLRCLFFIIFRAHFSILVRAVHIPGKENILADAISRDNLGLLFSQVPRAVGSRCLIPWHFLEVLVFRRPDWTLPAWSRSFRNCFLRD